jgi:hypothetical protein
MKVKSVKRLDQPTTIIPKSATPLITSTGVLIGVYYTPVKPHQMTQEDEFWQAVLLGIEGEYSIRRVARFMSYAFLVLALMFTTYWKVKEASA